MKRNTANTNNKTLHLYALQHQKGSSLLKEKEAELAWPARETELIKTQLDPLRTQRTVLQEAHSSPCSLLK